MQETMAKWIKITQWWRQKRETHVLEGQWGFMGRRQNGSQQGGQCPTSHVLINPEVMASAALCCLISSPKLEVFQFTRKWSRVDGVAVVRVCCDLSMSAPVCSVPRPYQLLNASTYRNRICSAFSKSIYHWPNLKRFLYSFHEYVHLLIIIYWLLVINQPCAGHLGAEQTWTQALSSRCSQTKGSGQWI